MGHGVLCLGYCTGRGYASRIVGGVLLQIEQKRRLNPIEKGSGYHSSRPFVKQKNSPRGGVAEPLENTQEKNLKIVVDPGPDFL